MWIIILLVGLNIIVILLILYVVGCSDSSPKFQIPNNEHLNNPTGLADVESPKMSPWEYYSSLKHKSWNELSEYEKGRMVRAAHLILDEYGTLSTLSELEEFLQLHLPELPKPYPGGDGALGGFREWQHCQKK